MILGSENPAVGLIKTGERRSGATGRILKEEELQSRLRRKRGMQYLDALRSLDKGEFHADSKCYQEVIEAIGAEFSDFEPTQWPIGYVSRCFLGDPYEVHILNLLNQIVEHFKRGKPMPSPFEGARSLTMHKDYVFVEVYANFYIAIDGQGRAAVL